MVQLPAALQTLIRLLQKCKQRKDVPRVKQLYSYMLHHQLDTHAILGDYLVSALADCGCVLDARRVFDRLILPSEHSWTSLISCYIDHADARNAFLLYHKMLEAPVQLKSYTYLSLLKSCARLNDTGKGQELHSDVVKQGLDGDPFLGSALVDMYGKCHLLMEACYLFHKLEMRDAVAWTTVIDAYAELGFGKEAQQYFTQMQLEGVSPDANTFVCILKSSGYVGSLELGKLLHADITKRGLERQLYLSHTLLDMYVKAGLLVEAQDSFDKMPERDVISWTVLIAGYVDYGLAGEAMRCFQELEAGGVSPVAATFLGSLKASALLGAIDFGCNIHAEIIKRGIEQDFFVSTALVDMYSKCSSLSEAHRVFERLQVQGVISWNALIGGYVEHGYSEEAVNCYEQMQLDSISPIAGTFVCSLKACGVVGILVKGQEIHTEVTKRGLGTELDVGNTLVDMYAKCFSLVEAQDVFNRLPVRSVVSWTAIMAGYAANRLCDEVRKGFRQMQLEKVYVDTVIFVSNLKSSGTVGALDVGQEIHSDLVKKGLQGELFVDNAILEMYVKCGSLAEAQEVFVDMPVRDAVSWNALIAGYAKLGAFEEALSAFEQLRMEGIPPVEDTFSYILKACSALGALEVGQEVYAGIIKRGLESGFDMRNMLVDMHAKCGAFVEARVLFDQLSRRNVVSWAALIAGCMENGLGKDALDCFKQMQLESISPDVNAFMWGLKACSTTGDLGSGQEIHAELTKRAWEGELYVHSSQLDMYAKCGALVDAQELFDRLPIRNVVSWNTLIAGYADHGFSEEALDCFNQMQDEGVFPVPVTFACCLKASAGLGALDRGKDIHSIVTKTGLERETFVGSAVACAYAKCGWLVEAKNVFDKLPSPDVVSWNAMLKVYGDNHEGTMVLQCFEDLQKRGVKPDANTLTCFLTACSHMNMVDEGLECFEVMREKHGIEPSVCHYTCVVDLLARSGRVNEAEKFALSMQCFEMVEVLRALLHACKVHGEVEVGLRCFMQLLQVDKEDTVAYLLMSDIYASAGRWSDVNRIEAMRKCTAANKMPGSILIEVNNRVHEFVVHDDNQNDDVAAMLEMWHSRMKQLGGYVPSLELVLRQVHAEGH